MDYVNNNLGTNKNMSIESHETAPLTDIAKELPESKVSIPDDEAVNMAKEWVDVNEK